LLGAALILAGSAPAAVTAGAGAAAPAGSATISLAPAQEEFSLSAGLPESARSYSGAELVLNLPPGVSLAGHRIDISRFPNQVSNAASGGRSATDGSVDYRFGFFTTENTYGSAEATFLTMDLLYSGQERKVIAIKEIRFVTNGSDGSVETEKLDRPGEFVITRLAAGPGGDGGDSNSGDSGGGDGSGNGDGAGGGDGSGNGDGTDGSSDEQDPGSIGGNGSDGSGGNPASQQGQSGQAGLSASQAIAGAADPESELADTAVPLGLTARHIKYVNGYPDGTFRPDADITRAEVASILFRLATDGGAGGELPQASPFADVAVGAWHAQAVAYMAGAGAVNGYPDGTFRPDAPITRAEFAAILSRFGGEARSEETGVFSDVADGHWASAPIRSAAETGWITGYPDGTFKPESSLSRAEMVAAVNRMQNRGVVADDIPDWAESFADVQQNHWAYAMIVEAANGHEYEYASEGLEREIWTSPL
jgi:hypothetical protein